MYQPDSTHNTLAAAFVAPAWASHVAVRRDGSKVEAALWDADLAEYCEDSLEQAEAQGYSAAFDQRYWVFVPIPAN